MLHKRREKFLLDPTSIVVGHAPVLILPDDHEFFQNPPLE
jgi:hypothetical protein